MRVRWDLIPTVRIPLQGYSPSNCVGVPSSCQHFPTALSHSLSTGRCPVLKVGNQDSQARARASLSRH